MADNRHLPPEGREYVDKAKNLLRDFQAEYDDAKAEALARKLAGEKKKKRDKRPEQEARRRLLTAGRKLPLMAPGVDALGGGVLAAIPMNYDFRYRAIPELLGLHSDLQCGVGYMNPPDGGPRVAICMVSGSGYINRDLGGLAEDYMGVDIAVLPAPGRGNQAWKDEYVAPLVAAQEAGSFLWLLRQHEHERKTEYRFCGAYRIADRWRTRVAFVEGDGGATAKKKKKDAVGNFQCFFKLERLPGQGSLRPVALPKDLNSPPESTGAKPQAERRREQIHSSRKMMTGEDTARPEICANCLMEGDGRNDILECEGCAARLAEGPPCPEPCQRHECWKRPNGCIHSSPALLCFECVDAGDAATAKREDTAWACAACADRFDLWGDTAHTQRGAFMLREAMAAAMARCGVGAAALPAALPAAASPTPTITLEEEGDEAEPSGGAAPVARRSRKAAGKRKAAEAAVGPSSGGVPAPRRQRRAARGGAEGEGEGEAGPSPVAQPAATEQRAASPQSFAPTVPIESADEGGDEAASPCPAAQSPQATTTPALMAVKGEPHPTSLTGATTAPAEAPPAVPTPSLAAIIPLLQSCPEVRETRGLIGQYALKYRMMSPAERQEDHATITMLAQMGEGSGFDLKEYLEGMVRLAP